MDISSTIFVPISQVEKVEEFEPGQESYAGVIKNLKEGFLSLQPTFLWFILRK